MTYRIGQKVETPLGVGEVVALGNAFNGVESYRVKFTLPKDENGYLHPIIELPHYHLKPYKTARERLLEMGLILKIRKNWAGGVFSHEWWNDNNDRVVVFFVDEKVTTVYEASNEIMRIIPEYLEWLEEEK